MSLLTQYLTLTKMQYQMWRYFTPFIVMVQLAFTFGMVLGYGYLIPDISDRGALYLTTGAATQALITIGLIGLPQHMAESKAFGRLEYFLTLPISREIYLLSIVTMVALISLPGMVISIIFGAWHYDLSLQVSAWVLVVGPLGVLCLSGFGIAIAILSPHQQLTNAITQLMIFYALLFAPVMIPEDQLPDVLNTVAIIFPTTYVADAVRGALSDIPGTHLARSMATMVLFSFISVGLAAAAIRRRA